MTREEREEALDVLTDMANVLHLIPTTKQGKVFKMVLQELQKPEQKWIPVSQPPKASGRYIVTRHFFDNDFVEMANYSTDLHTVDKYDFPKHKAGWYGDDSEYGHYELDDIVAWMPRPESFKGN